MHKRNAPLSQEAYDQLSDDMKTELAEIGEATRLVIVKDGKGQLGAEVGSIFVEFKDKTHAEKCFAKLDGRNYDGRKIKVIYIDEALYLSDLYLE